MAYYLTGHRAVATAALIATLAHAGQTDKLGRPYIDHPRRVAGRLVDATWDELVLAWLHDVVEDTCVTLEAIVEAFGPDIAASLDAITHRPGEPRAEYYARVRTDSRALKVKLADIDDNTDPERTAALDDPTRERLAAKYAAARNALAAP